MRFDSVTFWLFFAVSWAAWRCLPFGLAKTGTLILSLLFYAWWRPEYLLLILFSTVVDYHVGKRIHAARQRPEGRRWMALSLTVNLGLLAIFKYTPFVVTNLGELTGWFRAQDYPSLTSWVIPVGISFYTFQTLSYSLDIYRGRLEPAESFRDFFLFVSFYPQLVAGPIVRAKQLLPQFEHRRPLSALRVQMGLYYAITGLFLKVVVADNLARPVEHVYHAARIAKLTPTEAWLGTIYFGTQIFADFAGYSGIAIGLAYLLGLTFPQNFRYPYISQGLSEFWTRWHISLSEWLRDYLYIPLGGSRSGRSKTYLNLMITMLLGGLWHGAAWTFVVWGGMHGAGLCIERAMRGDRRASNRGPLRGVRDLTARLLRILVVFVFVHTAWVFFRAEDFAMAWGLLGRMYIAPFTSPLGLEALADSRHLVLALPVVALHVGELLHEWKGFEKTAIRRLALTILWLLLLTIIQRKGDPQFIYFQF